MSRKLACAWLLVLAAGPCACLPVEERAKPGQLELRVALDPDGDQLVSEDGYRIRFEQAHAALGHVRLEPGEPGAECDQYASSPYLRIVDLLAGSTRIATLFARGPCALRFMALGPNEHELVTDVDDAVVQAMRVVERDPFGGEGSVVLRVAGSAERTGEQLRFAWTFRQGFDVDPCVTAAFEPDQPERLTIRARLPALFADASDGRARFEPMAAADRAGDGDGTVTLDELHASELGRHLYHEVVPRLFWIGDNPPCFVGEIRVHPRTD